MVACDLAGLLLRLELVSSHEAPSSYESRSSQVLPVYSGAVVSGEVLDDAIDFKDDFCEPIAATGAFDPDIEPVDGYFDVGRHEVGFVFVSLRHGDVNSSGFLSQRQ